MTAINSNLAERMPYHKILNKGHKFALIETDTNKVITTARRAESLKPFTHFRPDLEIIDVNAKLDALIAISKT